MNLDASQDSGFNSARLKSLLKRSQRDLAGSSWNRSLSIDKERLEASRLLSESDKSGERNKKIVEDDDVIIVEATTSNSAKNPKKYHFEKVNDPKEEKEINKLIARQSSASKKSSNRQAESELRKIAESLNLKPIETIKEVKTEKIVSTEIIYEDCTIIQDEVSVIETKESSNKRTKKRRRSKKKKRKTIIDSYLGTVSSSDDLQINKFASDLSGKMKLPYVFMTREEFERLKSSTNAVNSNK